jgi:MATE family multidrug resistance protein
MPPTARPAFAAWRAEARATLALAWPIALTNLSQMALLVTDTVMLGHYSAQSLAASVLGANLYWLTMPLVFGLTMAAAPMLAQARGRKLHHVRDMRRTVRQGLWAVALATLPSWAVLWNGGHILRAIGQDAALVAEAETYLHALMWGLAPFGWFMVLRAHLAALERPKPAMVVAAAAIAFNALFDWLLIFGHWGFPELGIAGAGWASTASTALMFAGLAAWMQRDRQLRRFHLAGRFWRADWPRLAELFRIGLPISAMWAFETGVFSVSALLIGYFGPTSLAAHAITIQVAAVTFMVPMGISQAATARVGLAEGAGDHAGVQRAGWTAIGLCGLFMTATAVVLLSAPRAIAGLFLDAADANAPPVLDVASSLLMLAGLFQVFDGTQAAAAGALRGLKDTRWPMLIAAFGYWAIGIVVGAGLGFGLGWRAVGLWCGLVLGLAVVALLLVLRWARLSGSAAALPVPALATSGS